jgi:hypothetical protein
VDTEDAGLVGSGGDYAATARVATNDDGLAGEGGVADLLDGDEEGVEVNVKNVTRHRESDIAQAFERVKQPEARSQKRSARARISRQRIRVGRLRRQGHGRVEGEVGVEVAGGFGLEVAVAGEDGVPPAVEDGNVVAGGEV